MLSTVLLRSTLLSILLCTVSFAQSPKGELPIPGTPDGRLWGYRPAEAPNEFVIEPQFDLAGPFSRDGLAPVRVGENERYINLKGEFVFEGTYERAARFSNGLASVRVSEDRFEIIDRFGNRSSPIEASWMGSFERISRQQHLAPILIGGSYGYIDQNGLIVIPPKFKRAGSFTFGVAPVLNGTEYEYITPDGEPALSGRFTNAGEYSFGFARVEYGTADIFIDRRGDRISLPRGFRPASDFREQFAAVCTSGGDIRYGLIDRTGDLLPMDPFELLTFDHAGGVHVSAKGGDDKVEVLRVGTRKDGSLGLVPKEAMRFEVAV